jgi:uncharacterized protein with von Willebrand factor type A (vWA) domain
MFDETSDTLHPTDNGLTENIVRFSNLLKDNGVSVSLPAVLDTFKSLPLIDISNPDTFKCLLQVNLISRKEDITKFDRLYYAYWLPPDPTKLQIPSEESQTPQKENGTVFNRTQNRTDLSLPEEPEATSAQEWTIRYSPDSLLKMGETAELRFAESKALYATICKLLQPLSNRLSRRFQYTVRGKEVSLRKILRKNMQFGGELILLDFRKKKVKRRRVVFFCDVSGSMDIYTLMILQFIHALKRIDGRTEIFFFSTELSRGTLQFDLSNFAPALSRIPQVVSDWGGGTRIGHCLRLFNQNYGRRMLSSKDIVMIFSDGWDRGEIDMLETQMAMLRRRAYKIIWLNPLMGTKDYQPICQGMSTALPYVDYFLPMGNLQDLYFVGRTLEKMMV